MSRKRFSEREVIETLWHQGVRLLRFRCHGVMMPVLLGPERELYFPVQREHIHELELGGPDIPANCRYSHIDCHAVITNGTKATSAGSSKHRIAKTKRIAKGKMAVVKQSNPVRDAEPMNREPKAKAGLKVNIELKPGLPQGDFEDTLNITTNQGSEPLTVKVIGNIASDLLLMGPNVFRERSLVNLGAFPQKDGKKHTVFLLVKGPHRDDTKISIESIEPTKEFSATLGEPIGSALLALLIFGQEFQGLQLVGFVVLLAGILIAARGERAE